MIPSVASGTGDWTSVVNVVNSTFESSDFYLLAETNDPLKRPVFTRTSKLSQEEVFLTGRSFDVKKEVRWRKISSGKFWIHYLSETTPPPASAGLTVLDVKWKTREGKQKLYGTFKQSLDRWIEVSVPGAGNYRSVFQSKCNEDDALQITTVDYFLDGCIQMSRFCEVATYG